MENRVRTLTTSSLTGILLLLTAVARCEVSSFEQPDIQGFHAALNKAYPEYSIFQWPDSMRGYRVSPANFVEDVLFGDFNFDDVTDFSAKLIRAPTEKELSALPPRYREAYKVVGLVVVCDGLVTDGRNPRFRCTEISDEEQGGNSGWLDLTEWTTLVDYLSREENLYNNPECPRELKAQSGKKLLSLVEPIGHCNAFFYPLDSGGYGRCEYCAD
jgi:hypothetical protein